MNKNPKKQVRRIINKPNYKSRWGYKDKPFQQYDEAILIPQISLYDGDHNSAPLDELKKKIRVGKVYKIKPKYSDKKVKAKLVAIYSDPIGWWNKGKNTDVRLNTEWVFQEPVGSYPSGRHELIEDINLDYRLRSKKREIIQDKLWQKHGMRGDKALQELKELIKQKKLRRF